MKRFFSKEIGFTLIELMVVISIIGILSGFIMANYIGVQQRARDAQRKSDLLNMRAALEIYRADQGAYPATLKNCGPGNISFGFPAASNPCTTTYMRQVPNDPKNTGQFIYTYSTSAPCDTGYCIIACLENVNDGQKDTTNNAAYCTGGSTNRSFTVYNP